MASLYKNISYSIFKVMGWNMRVKYCTKSSNGLYQILQFNSFRSCAIAACEENKSPTSQPINIATITNGDPDIEKKLKILFLEVEIMRQEGGYVPEVLNTNKWKDLLEMDTKSKRKRYLTFLRKNELKNLKEEEKKKLKKEERLLKLSEMDKIVNNHIQYGLNKNTLFLSIYDTTVNHFHNCKLIQAMQFGQKLVLDCGYDQHMVKREAKNCAKQLMLSFVENRLHNSPFDLHFCNAVRNGDTMKSLERFIPPLHNADFPVNITEKSYLDIFPKEKIVYLTPHCREELMEYDHDAIYIIGAIVDKTKCEPLSLAKAKKEGVKMAKLPLDRFLTWGCGSGKSLTVNHMVQILLELKTSGDWDNALKFVPTRKLFRETNDDSDKYIFQKSESCYEYRKVGNVIK